MNYNEIVDLSNEVVPAIKLLFGVLLEIVCFWLPESQKIRKIDHRTQPPSASTQGLTAYWSISFADHQLF